VFFIGFKITEEQKMGFGFSSFKQLYSLLVVYLEVCVAKFNLY